MTTEPRFSSGSRRRRHRRGRRGGQRPNATQPLGEGSPVEGSPVDGAPGAPSVDGAIAADAAGVAGATGTREGRDSRRHPRHPVNPAGLEQRCVRSFPRVALVRGREYFRSGYVSDISQMGNAFSLTVQGRANFITCGWIIPRRRRRARLKPVVLVRFMRPAVFANTFGRPSSSWSARDCLKKYRAQDR